MLLAPVEKRHPFTISSLAADRRGIELSLQLQGASDTTASPDHHVRVGVNGVELGEARFDGKSPYLLKLEIPRGILAEGQNFVTVENVGDTGAPYSLVMLESFEVDYPRAVQPSDWLLDGAFLDSGALDLGPLSPGAVILDVTDSNPRWLVGGPEGVRVEAGRRYYGAAASAVRKPGLRRPAQSRLASQTTQADWVVIGPRAFLDAAAPLVELRRSQGLATRAVSLEDITAEFGYGEARPEAIRDFLAHAYERWQRPALRYVLLLGDGSYDFKDYL